MKTVKQPTEVLFKSLDFADKIVMLPIIDRFANAIRTNCDISIMELNSHDDCIPIYTKNRTTKITIDNAKKMFKILSDLDCRTSLGESYEDIIKSDNSQENWHTILLSDPGTNKLQVIKILRERLNLGLKEAKNLVDAYPTEIDLTKYNVEKSNYLSIFIHLELSGATVQILKEPSI